MFFIDDIGVIMFFYVVMVFSDILFNGIKYLFFFFCKMFVWRKIFYVYV